MGLFSGWRYHARKTRKTGIFRVTSTRNGIFSFPRFTWGIWTKWWKWSPKTGHSIDLPLIGGIRKRRQRRRSR